MLLSYSHRFIFIHIYKVAGSSVEAALGEYAHRPEAMLANRLLRKTGVEPSLPYPRYRMFPRHIKAIDLRGQLPNRIYGRFFKFALVRNPWDWQVSLYHYILEDNTHIRHDLVKSLGGFDEYLAWRVDNDRNYQKDFVTDRNGDLIVDFVGRYENLTADFGRICRRLNIDAQLPHVNRSNHEDYRSYYNPTTTRLIAEAYRSDIEFFGYTFDGTSRS